MNSQDDVTAGVVTVHLQYMNDANNTWTLYQRAERYEASWSGSHEVNFSFHCDTTVGFKWRFLFQNATNNTWDTLNYDNPTWNRTLIYKIA